MASVARSYLVFVLFPAIGPWLAVSTEAATTDGRTVLWEEPKDISYRDLFFGPGGKEHEPTGPFQFLEEDFKGTNPKFSVEDRTGVKWIVKLGAEARPETAASRLIWAAGYFANEDYLMHEFRAEKMPTHLRRGGAFVLPDGSLRNVRLKRKLSDMKSIGTWQWSNPPFQNTREFNGLRVLMALINNWDLTDEDNVVFRRGGQ